MEFDFVNCLNIFENIPTTNKQERDSKYKTLLPIRLCVQCIRFKV